MKKIENWCAERPAIWLIAMIIISIATLLYSGPNK
jgi:hypothetical protein